MQKKGQDPLYKKISPEKRSIQARDSNLNANEKTRQRDKTKSPQPINPKQFQINNPLVLPTTEMNPTATMEASATINTTVETRDNIDNIKEEVAINTPMNKNKETTITTPVAKNKEITGVNKEITGVSKKKVTTIFVIKKAKAKNTMPKRANKKLTETKEREKEVDTSDEELLEAANILEKEQEEKRKKKEYEEEDSDEELLLAAVELEKMQLKEQEHEETPQLNLMPSQSLTQSHPDGAQGWKEEQLDRADGAVGGTPPSTPQQTKLKTPPPAEMTPATPSPSRARVNCTPLWKRKSIARMSSSFSSSKKGDNNRRRMSQLSSPTASPTPARNSIIIPDTTPTQLTELPDHREAHTGSQESPNNMTSSHIYPPIMFRTTSQCQNKD